MREITALDHARAGYLLRLRALEQAWSDALSQYRAVLRQSAWTLGLTLVFFLQLEVLPWLARDPFMWWASTLTGAAYGLTALSLLRRYRWLSGKHKEMRAGLEEVRAEYRRILQQAFNDHDAHSINSVGQGELQ